MTSYDAVVLTAAHRGWEAPMTTPAMSINHADGHRIGLTNRSVTRNGRPYVPVSGEFHYTRVPRAAWERRLRAARNGGLNVIAVYIFWNHHQPVEDEVPDFSGNRDLRGFVELCESVGLDVVLRIGPWCHGEVRNGGFPDWVQNATVEHRTDDPRYLALVEPWYQALAVELEGLFAPGSNVIGIQVENELYDQPDHIATLKQMALDAGMHAPLWMATAWGSAQLPEHEVLPMYGGYADGFWVDADEPWDDSFREHFYFSHVWDDPGIGADVREMAGKPLLRRRQSPSDEFPPVTCELGGGMATAYHRRPVLAAEDIAAIANAKIGNGSAWQGYYMYVGGLNPGLDLQESHQSGYPNDLPQIDYDFHAPIGAAGQLTRTHALLRQQHAFLEAVGERLTHMPSSLPDVRPAGVRDVETVRWAMRSDGTRGFVFINNQQPHGEPLPAQSATFELTLPGGDLTFPNQPITIPRGAIARFPFRLEVGQTELTWATANLLTLLERANTGRIAVLVEVEGIPARASFGGSVIEGRHGEVHVHQVGADAVVVLPAELAETAWIIDGALYTSVDELDVRDDTVRTWARTGAPVARFDVDALAFETLVPDSVRIDERELPLEKRASAAPPASSYGEFQGRASAPSLDVVEQDGAEYVVKIPREWRTDDVDVVIAWTGDVAAAFADDVLLSDRFWDGTVWSLVIPHGTNALTIRVLSIHPDSSIWIHPDFHERRANVASNGIHSVTGQVVRSRRHYRRESV